MKKISLYLSIAFAALFMGACNDDFTDWSEPQNHPQEDAIKIPGFTATAVPTIDLATVADEVTLYTVSEGVLPAGFAHAKDRIEMKAAGVDNAELITLVGNNMPKNELQELVVSVFGKRPDVREFTGHVYSTYTNEEGEGFVVDCGEITLSIKPEAPQISANYYIIGAPSAWSPDETSLKFSHSGKDVYDDPVFTVVFPVEEGETWFAISDDVTVASGDWKDVFGCVEGNGNNGSEGKIDRRRNLSDDGSFKIVVNGDAKFIKVTINMMEYSYKIEKLNFQEYLWVAGSASGWTHVDMVSSQSFDGNYIGFMYLQNGFKFCTEAGWNGTNYGLDFSTDGGAPNWDLPAGNTEGYFMVNMSLVNLTLDLTPISTIGVIGDATAFGWDASTPLSYNRDGRCWEGDITFKDGKFKFRANDSWDINWGGDMDNLTMGGSDISVSAGTYHIAIYPNCPGKAYCTLVKK